MMKDAPEQIALPTPRDQVFCNIIRSHSMLLIFIICYHYQSNGCKVGLGFEERSNVDSAARRAPQASDNGSIDCLMTQAWFIRTKHLPANFLTGKSCFRPSLA